MLRSSISTFRRRAFGRELQCIRAERGFAKDNPGSETLSSTVTQGVIEKNEAQDPNNPNPVPLPTHPNRNMERNELNEDLMLQVPSMVPNEHTAERLPPQVPEMAEGGKYPDPLNEPMAEKMAPGPVNTEVHGTRPEADLLDVDVKRTIRNEEE